MSNHTLRSALWRRAVIAGLGVFLLAGFALSVGAAAATAAPASSVQFVVRKVVLTTSDSGAGRTYVAHVLDSSGHALTGATLDIGGLQGDPDQRVRTTPMKPIAGDPSAYAARIEFPVDGSWVLVVRVHTPSEYVHLASEAVTTGRVAPSRHDLSADPARRAVLAANPDFFKTYDPITGIGNNPSQVGVVDSSAHTAVSATASGFSHGGATTSPSQSLDVSAVLIAMLHLAGAISWLGAIAMLAFAGRLGGGPAQREFVRRVSSRYTLLAGGGLALVVLTGIANLQRATPKGFDLRALTGTPLGRAYVVVLAAKLGLAAASVILSVRIGQMLAVDRPGGFALLGLRSVGAAAAPARTEGALKLAEINAAIGGLILFAVIVLTQLSHALH